MRLSLSKETMSGESNREKKLIEEEHMKNEESLLLLLRDIKDLLVMFSSLGSRMTKHSDFCV
jgi:hypothetical protein